MTCGCARSASTVNAHHAPFPLVSLCFSPSSSLRFCYSLPLIALKFHSLSSGRCRARYLLKSNHQSQSPCLRRSPHARPPPVVRSSAARRVSQPAMDATDASSVLGTTPTDTVSADPNAPKRALSAYMFFANDNRDKVREENPGITFGKSFPPPPRDALQSRTLCGM